MDMKISGSGRISAGEYENIRVSGAAQLGGPIRCQSFHCSGSSHVTGDLEAQKEIAISGSTRFDGKTEAQDIKISGSASIEGNCTSTEEMRISGSMRCHGEVKGNRICVSGALHAESIEGEDVSISGKLICQGLLNAEHIVIKMNGASSEIGSIGGSSISICPEHQSKPTARLPLLSKLLGNNGHNNLTVRESIEGDEIALEMVSAQTVIGRVVAIGAGCQIKLVQYSEKLEISPDAKVEHQERI